MSNNRISKARRKAYNLQGGVCFYCRFQMSENRAKADHFYPKAKGGTNQRLNIVASCHKCNQLKADMMPDEYRHSEEFLRLVLTRSRTNKCGLMQI